MDLKIVKKGLFDYTKRKQKWALLLAAFGFTGYGVYRVYQSPSIARKRQRLVKLFAALVSITEAVSDSAEAIGVVSKDLREFLQSDSDKIPKSLKQISKITKSEEFSQSVIRVTQALTLGILRGYKSHSRSDGDRAGSSFTEKAMDKLFTDAGSGFASVVVGSFARNMVMALFSDSNNSGGVCGDLGTEMNGVPKWVDVVCSDQCRGLIGNCVQLFVSTAVAAYLDKTMDINTYDEFFAGLTNPKHKARTRDMLVSVCNGAIETLVKTSHQVLTADSSPNCDNSNPSSSYLAIDKNVPRNVACVQEVVFTELRARNLVADEVSDCRWAGSVSSTLAVPSNRRFLLEVTGRVTFETVRSFLEFLLEKVYDGMKRCVDMVHEAVVDGSSEVYRYVSTKTYVVATLCLSLCLQILGSVWILVPA